MAGMTKCAAQPPASRKERRAALKRADLGPDRDPIRQQGRDSKHVYVRERWYATPQTCDRSRAASARRLYHESYRTSSGHTWDEFFEQLQERADEFEAAGINLGWGGCSSPGATAVRGSVEEDMDRRYLPPMANTFQLRQIAEGPPSQSEGGYAASKPRRSPATVRPASRATPAGPLRPATPTAPAPTMEALEARLAELRARKRPRAGAA